MDSLMLRRRLFDKIAINALPFSCASNPVTWDSELRDYFIGKIYETYGDDITNKLYDYTCEGQGYWYNYSLYCVCPTYVFNVYNTNTPESNWMYDSEHQRYYNFDNYELYSGIYVGLRPTTTYILVERELGTHIDNRYTIDKQEGDMRAYFFNNGEMQHEQNELFDFYYVNTYPVYATGTINAIDPANVQGQVIIP